MHANSGKALWKIAAAKTEEMDAGEFFAGTIGTFESELRPAPARGATRKGGRTIVRVTETESGCLDQFLKGAS